MHVFWECRKLKHFWKAVHDLTVKVVETPLDITPTRYLFGQGIGRDTGHHTQEEDYHNLLYSKEMHLAQMESTKTPIV